MTFARPVAGGGGFDPLSLSPALWLDASDSSTLYDAVTGGSLVAADGLVARWEDKSGNARHVAQATSGDRPLRKTSQINGKDVVRFVSDDRLSRISSVIGIGTLFIVNKPTFTFLGGIFGSTNPDDKGLRLETSSTLWKSSGGDDISFGTGGALYINGSLTNNFGSYGIPHLVCAYRGSSHPSTYTDWSIGRYFSGRNYLGDIAEIILYPTALSTTNRQDVEAWLNTKYAIY
jgi:hypothetical protein